MQAESGAPFTRPPHAPYLRGPSERGEHEYIKKFLLHRRGSNKTKYQRARSSEPNPRWQTNTIY